MLHSYCVTSENPTFILWQYLFLYKDQFTVLPFGGSEKDFDMVLSLGIEQDFIQRAAGRRNLVYVGAINGSMIFPLRILFRAIQEDRRRHPGEWDQIRLYFIGTSYGPGQRARKMVEPVANGAP